MTCKIIKNKNGAPIGVADANGNPSKVFKQISQIPFLRNFDQAVNAYTYLKGKIPSLDGNKVLYQIVGEQGVKDSIESIKKNLSKLETSKDRSVVEQELYVANERLNNLTKAIELDRQGKFPREIFIATGWEKSKDGKWKYEIQDFKPKNVSVKLNDTFKLGDIITNTEELFSMYPQIADTNITFSNGFPKGAKMFVDENNNITINFEEFVKDGKFTDSRGVLNHEVQHIIQSYEGFARGGDPSEFYPLIQKYVESVRMGNGLPETGDRFERSVYENIQRYFERERALGRNRFNPSQLAHNLYLSLQGEIEARNVQNRLGLSEQERRETLFSESQDSVRYEDIIVAFENNLEIPQFQIIGEKGANRIEQYKNSLDEAKKLSAEGKDMSEIEVLTGWFKNKEGQWKRFSQELLNELGSIPTNLRNTRVKLADVINKESVLFKAYPELRKTSIEFYEGTEGEDFRGDYNINGTTVQEGESTIIYVRTDSHQGKDIQRIVSHELNHELQRIEGFARGGNPFGILKLAMQITNTLNMSSEQGIKKLLEYDSQNLTDNERRVVTIAQETFKSKTTEGAKLILANGYELLQGEIDSRAVETAYELLRRNQPLDNLTYNDLIMLTEGLEGRELKEQAISIFIDVTQQSSINVAQISNDNTPLQFRDKDGNIYGSLKGLLDSNAESFSIGVEDNGNFISFLDAEINSNPQTINGLIVSLIKDGLISDKSIIDTDGESVLVSRGENDLKKAITSDMARDLAKTYHGNIFKIGKDFNIKIRETEKASDSHNKSFKTLEREVGQEEAVERKTLQEYNTFVNESNRGGSDLDFSLLPENQLVDKLMTYLNKLGVSTTSIEAYVEKYKLKNGVHPSAQALADLSNNIIAFKDGLVTEAELIEEVSHFIVDSMDSAEKENMKANIHRTKEWSEYAQTYYDVYSQQGLEGVTLESAVREEILGKVLANSLKDNFQRSQENTIEGGIVDRLRTAFNNFFQRVSNFFKPSYQVELEQYTFNVFENLMNETLNGDTRVQGSSKFTLYSTNRVTPLQRSTKAWLETLNANQRELRSKYKISSSSNTLARQVRNLQGQIDDATYKNAISDLLSVTNTQIGLVEREIQKSLKNSQLFPQEVKAVYESIRSTLLPLVTEVKGQLTKEDVTLSKEIENTLTKVTDMMSKVPNVNKKALDNIVDRVIRKNNFTQEEADKFKDKIEKVLESAEADTSWFHAHLGGLVQARDPLLGLLGDVIEQMKFREKQIISPTIKNVMDKLDKSGFDILKLKNLIYKGEIINEKDPELVRDIDNTEKAEIYNTLGIEGDKADKDNIETLIGNLNKRVAELDTILENELGTLTRDDIRVYELERTNKTEALSEIEKQFKKRVGSRRISYIDPEYIKARDEEKITFNGQTISRKDGVVAGFGASDVQEFVDEYNQFSRQIWEINSIAEGGNLTESEYKEIRDIEAQRREKMNPRDSKGKLRNGLEEYWDSNLKTYLYSVNSKGLGGKELNEALKVATFQNLSVLNREFNKKMNGSKGEIPNTFLDALNSLGTEQEKLDFLKNNSTITFSQDFWDRFDPNESLVVRLNNTKTSENSDKVDEIIDRIRHNQSIISGILKSNRDYFNPAESKVESYFQQRDIRDAQTALESAKKEAKEFLPKEDREVTEGIEITTNEAYTKELSNLGIIDSGKTFEQEVEEEFNFARKHMTPKAEESIISLRSILNRLKNNESVTQSNFVKNIIGERTDYDNILREEIRKRLLPYYKRTEPSGYTEALNQMNYGVENNISNSVDSFINSPLIEVKPSNSFYDSVSRVNSEWEANKLAGREQYTKEYLDKVRNKEYYNRYNPDKDGNATTNVVEFKARQAWLEAYDEAIENYGLTGLHNRYQLPQQLKSVFRRISTSKGKIKPLAEVIRDATTVREDEMDLGQNIFGEKAKKGDSFLTIPRYGVTKVKNQEDVSDEILHSLIWFVQQSGLYKARRESVSDALALRDFLVNEKRDYAGKESKASNTYKMAESFINANFYGVKETFSYEMDIPWLGRVDIGKIARTFNSWTRFANLAGVTVPLTSMIQGKIQEAVETLAKESTSPLAYKLAQKKVANLLPGAGAEIMGFKSKSELNVKMEIMGVYDMLERFNNSNLNKASRTALGLNSGLHSLGNAPVTTTAAFSILLDYRVVDGRVMSERQYKSIFKNAKDWDTKPLFDDYWKVDEAGRSVINKEALKEALNITDDAQVDRIISETMESISQRALALVQRVDTQIPEHQKSIASRNAIANFFLMHMNWFLVAIPNKTKFKHNNLSEGGMEQEGNWRTLANVIGKTVRNPKDIKKIYNDVKSDDLVRRAVRRSSAEWSIGTALAIAAIMLANAVDDDDDPAYLLTWADYMLTRVATEQVSGTVALPNQVDNIITNPLVSYQRLKDLKRLPDLFLGGNDIITRGAYAGRSEQYRAAVKILPIMKDVKRFSDFKTERQTYAYFNLKQDGIFRNYVWLSRLAEKDVEEE